MSQPYSVYREAFLAKCFDLWPDMDFPIAILLSNAPWQAGIDALNVLPKETKE